MRAAPARRRCRGFSLLEALLALVLAGVVSTALTLALRTGLDASERVRERADLDGEARSALSLLAADLESAYLSPYNSAETWFVARPADDAAPGEPLLSFTSLAHRRDPPADADAPRADAVRVDYFLQPDPHRNGSRLLTRTERWLTETGPGIAETVCAGVAELRLRFPESEEGPERWNAAPSPSPRFSRISMEERGPAPVERRLPAAVRVLLALHGRSLPGETSRARAYRTALAVAADGILPFETDVRPSPWATAVLDLSLSGAVYVGGHDDQGAGP